MENQIGQLFLLGFYGPEIPKWMHDFARQFGLGGVLLFDYSVQTKKYENNIFSREQVKELNSSLHELPSRPLIYVDQEGGKVRRLKEKLGFAPLPSHAQFPLLSQEEKLRLLKNSFQEMKSLGFDVDLAPVVDLNLNPENPDLGKIERCFSDQVAVVRENAKLWLKAGHELGLQLCLKHYPGMGGAKVNSHEELADITGTFSEDQLKLFYELLGEMKTPMTLLSHGIVQNWDAGNAVSMSKFAVNLIRQEAPEAILITDDMQMQGMQRLLGTEEASLRAIRAGMDLLCIGNNLLNQEQESFRYAERLLSEAQKDASLAANIQGSIQRIQNLKKSASQMGA